MAIKTLKELETERLEIEKKLVEPGTNEEKPELKPDEPESTEKPKSKSANKHTLFVPFALPDVESGAVIEFEVEDENGEMITKSATIKIIDQKYKVNENDCGGKEFLKPFLDQLHREGFLIMSEVDPNLPTEWKIRHGDYANGIENNFTGVSYIDFEDGGKIELHWQNGFVSTKDPKIRDILVEKGHYDLTTGSLHIQKPDIKGMIITRDDEKGSHVLSDQKKAAVSDVGKGAHVLSAASNKGSEHTPYEPTRGTFTI